MAYLALTVSRAPIQQHSGCRVLCRTLHSSSTGLKEAGGRVGKVRLGDEGGGLANRVISGDAGGSSIRAFTL